MIRGQSYLSKEGRAIYKQLYNSVSQMGVIENIDTFELSMLANSFYLYADNARICNQEGIYQIVGENNYKQISPEYTVMKNEYANIMKHSPKFGINPSDREKLLKIAEAKTKAIAKEKAPSKIASLAK